MGKSSGGGGNPADVVGAARETGEQARRLNEAQTAANRPNQNNAWGSTQWSNTPTWDESTGQYVNRWTQTETLNPKLQEALDAQQNVQLGRSNLAQGQMGRVWDDLSQDMDFDQYGDPLALQGAGDIQQSGWDAMEQFQGMFDYDVSGQRQAAEDAAYQKAANRLNPQFEQEQAALLSRLRNQGLAAGDAAYDSAMANFSTGKNDAYEQARLGASAEGRSEADLAYQQLANKYGINQSANQQLYDQYMGGLSFDNAAQQQQFAQNVQQNQIANALRTQNINEDVDARQFSLNELERLLAGQQISGGPPSTGGQTDTIASKNLGG